MNLSRSIEDYLEAIYHASQDDKVVRVKNIGKTMKVSMPSVNQALQLLKKNGLINHESYGYIELTEKGRGIGEKISHRHKMLTRFLSKILNLPLSLAEKDACKMEHDISKVTLERLITFIKFVETCPHHEGQDWLMRKRNKESFLSK